MIGDAESAFALALSALELGAPIHRGVDFRELSPDSAVLTVDCRQIRRVTAALYSGEVKFLLSSPALQADLSLHDSRDNAIQDFIRSNQIKIHFESATLKLIGIAFLGAQTASMDYRWVSEIDCTCGIEKL